MTFANPIHGTLKVTQEVITQLQRLVTFLKEHANG